MGIFTIPVHEANDCHHPAGRPDGGQFCSKGGRGDVDEYVKRAKALGQASFIDDRETIFNNEAIFEIRPGVDGTAYLTGLRTIQHKQGMGTRVMTALTQLADEMGVTLTLVPKPLPVATGGSGGLKKIPQKKLVEFYKRFGFQGSAREMERRPRP